MLCVVCGRNIELKLIDDGGMHPYCSPACGTKWRTRNNFLFNLKAQTTMTSEQAIGLMLQRGFLDDDLKSLNRVAKVSTTLRPLAKEQELGGAFHKPAVHMQQVIQNVAVHKTSLVKTGKKIVVEKPSKDGSKIIKRTVDETREEVKTTYQRMPVISRKNITADQMLEIALMAYNTATQLRSLDLPVILYRVDTKGTLTSGEKKKQTLSSSVHAGVDGVEVWPIEKTAAWIQGAMRARVSFVLLNDPRAPGGLVGGVDKKSDAVYVRELHQITSMRYVIDKAPTKRRPVNMKGINMFILNPPARDLGVLPLIPRLTADAWSHTWDSSKSSLTLADEPGLIRDHLKTLFTDAGTRLGIADY